MTYIKVFTQTSIPLLDHTKRTRPVNDGRRKVYSWFWRDSVDGRAAARVKAAELRTMGLVVGQTRGTS